MASQVVPSQSIQVLTVESFILGYHAYLDVWTLVEDEMLRLIPQPSNSVDRNTIAVLKIVCHVPYCLAPIVSLFSKWDVNKACSYERESKSKRWG